MTVRSSIRPMDGIDFAAMLAEERSRAGIPVRSAGKGPAAADGFDFERAERRQSRVAAYVLVVPSSEKSLRFKVQRQHQ